MRAWLPRVRRGLGGGLTLPSATRGAPNVPEMPRKLGRGRVAGPASLGQSEEAQAEVMDAVGVERTSIAFFADPDPGIAVNLKSVVCDGGGGGHEGAQMSVADYIRWRSGRGSGIGYTETEKERASGHQRL